MLRDKFLKSFYSWEYKNLYQLEVIIKNGAPHCLRKESIKELGLVVPIIIVDDDMLLTQETNYAACVEKVKVKNVGIISTAWKRSEKISRKLSDVFEKRKLVFTGGGMCLSIAAQKVIIDMPNEPYWSDNIAWSVATNNNGLANYYYRGSCAIHVVCQRGGRKVWIAKKEYVLPPGVMMRKGVKDSFLMPSERDLC
jgi:hypothetical protein